MELLRSPPMTIAENYEDVLREVARAADLAGRPVDEITIVGVTKTFPAETVAEAARIGIREVGENRVQELATKAASLSHLDLNWHMIGHLQSNKVRQVLPLVALIHSVDRTSLAQEISRRASGAVPILLQVNTTGEASKFGTEPGGLEALVDSISTLPHLDIRGLMTIGPREGSEAQNRRAFALLRTLREQCRRQHPEFEWSALSMGMSGDFAQAIAEGATHIRVGSRIFGARPRPQTTEAQAR